MPATQQPELGEKHITIGTSTVPIRSVDVGPVRFEMWAEESRAKGKLAEKQDLSNKTKKVNNLHIEIGGEGAILDNTVYNTGKG